MSNHIRIARLEAKKWACKITTDGVDQDLTSCTITFTVKSKYTDADNAALFQLTQSLGVTVTDTAAGEYDLNIFSTHTQSVSKSAKYQNYVFDHRIQLSNGNIKQLEAGDFVVTPNVTDTMA